MRLGHHPRFAFGFEQEGIGEMPRLFEHLAAIRAARMRCRTPGIRWCRGGCDSRSVLRRRAADRRGRGRRDRPESGERNGSSGSQCRANPSIVPARRIASIDASTSSGRQMSFASDMVVPLPRATRGSKSGRRRARGDRADTTRGCDAAGAVAGRLAAASTAARGAVGRRLVGEVEAPAEQPLLHRPIARMVLDRTIERDAEQRRIADHVAPPCQCA